MIRESDVFGLTTDLAAKLLNPLTTTGDIIYSSSGSTPARLAIGGANTVLHGGTTPSYSGVAIADLTATGTPSSSTYLRGDNTWATISSGGITTVTSTGTRENPSISGTTLNIPNLFGGVWQPLGTVMTPDLVADGSNLQEPCVLYEGSPQILTDATGSVYKMLFAAGGATQNIMYAESVDGNVWSRRTTVCIANHARVSLLKVGSTYYCFCVPTAGFGQVDVYSSTDMVTWTLAAAAIISKGTAGTWNGSSVANMAVYYDGTTYHMLLSGTNGGGASFTTGYYHSTSITSGWTAYGSNPVMGTINTVGMQGSYLTKIAGTYYCWSFGPNSAGLLPTDIYAYSSPDMVTWTARNSGAPTYPRTQGDEGNGTNAGQVANPWLVEVSGKTHLFYSAVYNGSGLAPGLHLKHAVAGYTIANLIATNEGNGGAINFFQPSAYPKAASDLNYIPNSNNVGANAVWTTMAIQGQTDLTDYGWRLRDGVTTTTFTNLQPTFIGFYKTGGVNNIFNTGSSGINLQSWGPINFSNLTTGTAALGNFDASGNFTASGIVTAGTGGGGFSYQLNGNTNSDPTAVNGFIARQGTSATVGVPVQYSPPMGMYGNAWNTTSSANNRILIGWNVAPTSGATVGGALTWKSTVNFGATTTMATLDVSGNYTVQGRLNSALLTASKVVFTDASKNLTSTGIGTPSQLIAGDGSLVSAPTIVASADLTGQTAAGNIIAPYTVGASDGSFMVTANLNITAISIDVIQTQIVYTDETNTSRTLVLYGMGTTSAGLTATGVSNYAPVAEIRAKAGTTITVQTTLTTGAGSITFNAHATIMAIR